MSDEYLIPTLERKEVEGIISEHPITKEKDVECTAVTYTLRYKNESISGITQWYIKDEDHPIELEQVTSYYEDENKIRRLYEPLTSWEEQLDEELKRFGL